MVTFGEPLGHVITPMWPNFGRLSCVVLCALSWCSDGVVCPFKTSVCRFKTCPCVRSKLLRVYRHHARKCFNMRTAFWRVCTRCKLKKPEKRNTCCTSTPQEATLCGQKYELFQRRILEQKIKGSHFKARNRDEDRPELGAPIKWKVKGKDKKHAKNKEL